MAFEPLPTHPSIPRCLCFPLSSHPSPIHPMLCLRRTVPLSSAQQSLLLFPNFQRRLIFPDQLKSHLLLEASPAWPIRQNSHPPSLRHLHHLITPSSPLLLLPDLKKWVGEDAGSHGQLGQEGWFRGDRDAQGSQRQQCKIAAKTRTLESGCPDPDPGSLHH